MQHPNRSERPAIGYVRVSTEEQVREGVSLDAQRDKIRSYCELHGFSLGAIEADEGVSGKRADNRPGLQRALEHVCRDGAVLVVYSISRFARSTRDCIDLVARIERCGGQLASITERIDTTTPTGVFFFQLMASLAELERRTIGQRVSLAHEHKRNRGERVGRYVQYGFSLTENGRTLKPDAAEQTALQRMLHLKQQGTSYHRIADQLNEAGIKPRAGSRWYGSSVRAVLRRRLGHLETPTSSAH